MNPGNFLNESLLFVLLKTSCMTNACILCASYCTCIVSVSRFLKVCFDVPHLLIFLNHSSLAAVQFAFVLLLELSLLLLHILRDLLYITPSTVGPSVGRAQTAPFFVLSWYNWYIVYIYYVTISMMLLLPVSPSVSGRAGPAWSVMCVTSIVHCIIRREVMVTVMLTKQTIYDVVDVR